MPLHVEILYNEYQFAAAFAVASLLALLALVTVALKAFVEWLEDRGVAAAERARQVADSSESAATTSVLADARASQALAVA